MLTIGYVRVSTEDQVDHSPEAQRIRCGQYAKIHDLGPVQYLSDEGFSGKNLDRPAMQELLALIETGEVAHLVVWRLDRLTRDTGDQSRLIRLCEKYCVAIHSVNEGPVRVDTASGRMQAGIHGVFAQYYREHVVENVRMGQDQAARKGRWQNHAPTGYDLVNGYLQPNEHAHLVRRIFQLRADGMSYNGIERATGIKYSTARHICLNRAYLGEVTHRGETFAGLHEQLVTTEQFEAAQRAHIPGRRRGKDLLSGKVRCGHCGKVLCVEFNEKGTAIYRCKHRGKGCEMPGRSAPGLHRAARLGLGLIGHDQELQNAIRHELGRHGVGVGSAEPSRSDSVAKLRRKRQKLLDLYYADSITAEMFREEESKLTRQIDTIEAEAQSQARERERRHSMTSHFERVAEVLGQLSLELIWDSATEQERQTLVREMVDAVEVHPDHLRVAIAGAPPLRVTLAEVGLREPGMGSSVSKGGLEPPRDFSHQPLKLARLPISPLRRVIAFWTFEDTPASTTDQQETQCHHGEDPDQREHGGDAVEVAFGCR